MSLPDVPGSMFPSTSTATAVAERRRALRDSIARTRERLKRLPVPEQKRLYEQSRTESPTLFALLYRLQEDPVTDQLVRAAVERTRRAPSEAELGRALTRTFASAFRAGLVSFVPAGHFVLCRLREEFGEDNARRVRLAELQRAYLAGAARARVAGVENAATIMRVTSVSELWRHEADANLDAGAEGAADAPAGAPVTAATGLPASTTAGAAAEDALFATGLLAACLALEAGGRNYAEFAEAMTQDLGDTVKPYLRVFYEAIRHFPGIDMSALKPAAPADGFAFAL
jgi:hypothetical protein